jgi:hypothetical protein
MYLLSVLAQDEETQRKGCVGIFVNRNPFRQSMEHAFKLTNLFLNLGPIRYVGFHFCIDDHKQSMVAHLETVLSTAPQFSRVRFRFHSGTLTQE